MGVRVKAEPELEVSAPEVLFRGNYEWPASFDVMPGDAGFLLIEGSIRTWMNDLCVVLRWPLLLEPAAR